MKNLVVVGSVLLICFCISIDGNFWNLNRMIQKATGKCALLSYSMYGCHCGIGGKGHPVDTTDWCCHQHDCCYKGLESRNCNPYWTRYKYYVTYNGNMVTCADGPGTCRRASCECDTTLALCLKENLATYNKRYRFYFNQRCKGTAPAC